MTAAPIHLAGERLMLDPAGALYWPATGLLGGLRPAPGEGLAPTRAAASFCRPGTPAPRCDRLTLLLRRYQPRVVIALGDSFHDADGVAPPARRRAGPPPRP